MSPMLVAAFYAFTPLDTDQREALLSALPPLAREGHVLGSVLVASEGVNGTISGPEAGVDSMVEPLESLSGARQRPLHTAGSEAQLGGAVGVPPFQGPAQEGDRDHGVAGVDPRSNVGTYVDPEDWNALVDDPDTLVIDTRNHYETAIGSFAGAIDPGTDSFRDFPQWAESELRPGGRHRPEADRHVLHRRYPPRESQQLLATTGVWAGSASPERRHSQVPRAGS